MPILVQDVVNSAKSRLDAEGSDRYLFDPDFKPAINDTIKWIVSLFDAAFSEKKFAPESLRELIRTGVWIANKYSRISFDPTALKDDLWTVIGIFPEPNLHPNNSIAPLVDPVRSQFAPDKSYVSSDYSAERMTSEEWNENRGNPFAPGNEVMLSDDFKKYGYRDFSDYSSSGYTNIVDAEIEIRPSVALKYVAIEFVKKPDMVALITDSIQFPSSIEALFTDKVLNYIAVKQGDQTNLYGITEKDIATLVKLMS